MRLRNDSPSCHPVDSQIRGIGPRNLHYATVPRPCSRSIVRPGQLAIGALPLVRRLYNEDVPVLGMPSSATVASPLAGEIDGPPPWQPGEPLHRCCQRRSRRPSGEPRPGAQLRSPVIGRSIGMIQQGSGEGALPLLPESAAVDP